MTKLKKAIFPVIALIMALTVLSGVTAKAAFAKEAPAPAQAISVNAKSALLMDFASGTVVYEMNTRQHLPIASMVKIMTLLITFEEIEAGRLTVDTPVTASANATSMGGSQAFLDTNASYKVDELIKSIVVASANDSCVAMGEHISGDITSFVDRMNTRAAELGMNDTVFANCTGLPADNQYSCAYDVALMTRELLTHKDFYNYSKIWMFDFAHPGGRVTQLSNTNKLIRAYEGCDGGKTGFTQEAMYCLSATAKRGMTRLISVVMGSATSKERNAENAKLFNYGFANYETKQFVVKDNPIEGDYAVTRGKEKTVKAAPAKDFYMFVKKGEKPDVKFVPEVGAISAPLSAGQKIGEMKVVINGQDSAVIDLNAVSDISKMTYLDALDEVIHTW